MKSNWRQKDMNDLISIIVPVYKVEKELPKCLDSILTQTYSKLEILLIDDGSPDRCPEICEEYARKDDRIKVFHKVNGGLSSARNYGLDRCTGEYIAFVDSDDWITPDFIETLWRNLKKENADLSIVGYALAWESGEKMPYSDEKEYLVFDKEQAIREMMIQQRFQCMVCIKLHKKELFKEVRFPEGKLFEDAAITLDIFKQCERVVFCGKPLYMYYQRAESIVNSGFGKKKLDMLKYSEGMIEYSNENNKIYDIEAHTFYLQAALMLILQAYNDPDNSDSQYAMKYIYGEIKKYKKYIFHNPYIQTRRKIVMLAILMKVSPKIINKLWKVKVNH